MAHCPTSFVYVKAGAEKYTFAPPAESVTLDQVGCMYSPHVLGLMAGQILKIASRDPTTHNIHPMPAEQSGMEHGANARRRAD